MTEAANRAALEQEVTERAAADPQFRQDLLSDPRGTVERELGISIPERVQVTVLEETPSAVYLVLPPAPAQTEQELSDTDLEAVAGGWDGGGGITMRTCRRTICPGGNARPECGP